MGQGRGQKSQQSLITIHYTYPQGILLTNGPSKYLIFYGGENTFDIIPTVSRCGFPKSQVMTGIPDMPLFILPPTRLRKLITWNDLQEQILYIQQILWLMNNLSIAF